MVFTHYWDCMRTSLVSLAQEPETGAFPPAMQGSHGVSTLEKGLLCQRECECESGRKEGFL